ncbi:glyoxalase-like domain protein [Lepidopterella palustris CBS 459.81]|uniref:Glyoxalase-like domain protein n=1 Tax=Lepidopterella palustris CBS 459.81 TaxID=1314670 RepID=A0A8E2DZ79_9PEZI|nr:glyoxalase-like domain protein [Lepidopterella palustris CBS 459.81]
MLGHVSIRVTDLEASVQFYLAALAPLSYEAMRFPEVIGFGSKNSTAPIPDLWLRKHNPGPQNNNSAKPTPVHISFYVEERKTVHEFHACGIKAGGKDNGAPGVRPFMDNYYAAYVFDLDGNNIEVVCFAAQV